jgi:hypothetical protein
MYVAPAVQLLQNPSLPARPREVVISGRRISLSQEMSLLLPQQRNASHLILHFHGPGWLPEVAARKRYPGAAVLTVQAAGPDTTSDAYREMLSPGEKFPALLKRIEAAASTRFKWIVLSSFSAGYGAVREILRDRSNWDRIEGVILADSIHASYGGESRDLAPFLDFARESLKGGKLFLITHSEVSTGAYASTAEAASFLLKELNLKRSPFQQEGRPGMRQNSAVTAGGLQVLGFAGSAPEDHMDHYFALEDWYRRLVATIRKDR